MADIEPYKQIKKTNIQEHNDLVGKINEIVNVINNAELEGIGPRLDTIESTDTLQWKDIESIKAKDTEQDNKLADNTKVLAGIIDSSVSNVAIMDGTTTGNIKVRIGRENAPSIDSDDYNIQKPTSVELVQGSAPAMVKAQITLSDGTVLVSDDFMFTTESIGQDVYISSFVFKNGNVAGSISADIGLSNGTTLEANNFVVPTDPNVISSITDLQNRMTAVESADVGELATLKTTVAEHTVAITALDNDVEDMMLNKADLKNTKQGIEAHTIEADSIIITGNRTAISMPDYVSLIPNDLLSGIINENMPIGLSLAKYNDSLGRYVGSDAGNIALLDDEGNPKNFTSGGKVWEEIDLNVWPTDWVIGERVKVDFKLDTISTSPYVTNSTYNSAIVEFTLSTLSDFYPNIPISVTFSDTYLTINTLNRVLGGSFNGDSGPIFVLRGGISSGGYGTVTVMKSTITTYVRKMWRLRP